MGASEHKDYSKLRSKAQTLLTKYGRHAILVHKHKEVDPEHPAREAKDQTTFFPCIAAFLNYSESDKENSKVVDGSIRVLVAPWDHAISQPITTDWEVWDGKAKYTVVTGVMHKPGREILMFDLQCKGAGYSSVATYGDSFTRGDENPVSGSGLWDTSALPFSLSRFVLQRNRILSPVYSNSFLTNDINNPDIEWGADQFFSADITLDKPQSEYVAGANSVALLTHATLDALTSTIAYETVSVDLATGRFTMQIGQFFGETRLIREELAFGETSVLRTFPMRLRLEHVEDQLRVYVNGELETQVLTTRYKEQTLAGLASNTPEVTIDNVSFGLVEPSSEDYLPEDAVGTNLLASPYEFNSLDWSLFEWQNQGIEGGVLSPGDCRNAYRINVLEGIFGTNKHCQMSQSVSGITDAGTYSLSFYVKRPSSVAAQTPEMHFNFNLTGGGTPMNKAVVIDLDTMTTLDGDTTINKVPNDWYKVKCTVTNNGTGNDTADIDLNWVPHGMGGGTAGKYIYGHHPVLVLEA